MERFNGFSDLGYVDHLRPSHCFRQRAVPTLNDYNIAFEFWFISSLTYFMSSLGGLVTGPLCDQLGVRLLAAAALLFGTVESLV